MSGAGNSSPSNAPLRAVYSSSAISRRFESETCVMSMFNTAFAGRHVTILSSTSGAQERTDTGTLVEMEGNWIQLAKDNGEMLLFPATAIRVIKLLDVEPPYSAVKQTIPDPIGTPLISDPLR
jgi:hypothetical protein